MSTNYPKPFDGTDTERRANNATHMHFYDDNYDGRCGNCDARSGSVSADYPCGADVPRETRV